MARAAGRQPAAAAHSVGVRELDDGAGERRGHSRLRDDVQGVPARGDPQHTALWRDASVYSGAGELVRREHLRDTNLEPGAAAWTEPLWNRANGARVLRPDDDPVSAAVYDAAAALLRVDRRAGHAERRS